MKKAEKNIIVTNTLGIHARPASMLVRTASAFESDVFLDKTGEPVNCKSVLSVLMLSAGKGTPLRISAEGADAAEAVEAVAGLFAGNFGEE